MTIRTVVRRFLDSLPKFLARKNGERGEIIAASAEQPAGESGERKERKRELREESGERGMPASRQTAPVRRKTGRRRHPRNNVFQSHWEIREALRSLRDDDKKILDYSEELKANSIIYSLKIREDKRPLVVHFIHPGRDWPLGDSAYNTQVFLRRPLEATKIKEIFSSHIEARIRGWRHEDRGLRLLQELARELDLRDSVFKIKSARFATEDEDRKKNIDYVVTLDYAGKEMEMPIQCRSSLAGREAHKKANSRISSIMITDARKDEKLKGKFVYMIDHFTRGEVSHR